MEAESHPGASNPPAAEQRILDGEAPLPRKSKPGDLMAMRFSESYLQIKTDSYRAARALTIC
jgi:hypothetical protein